MGESLPDKSPGSMSGLLGGDLPAPGGETGDKGELDLPCSP